MDTIDEQSIDGHSFDRPPFDDAICDELRITVGTSLYQEIVNLKKRYVQQVRLFWGRMGKF